MASKWICHKTTFRLELTSCKNNCLKGGRLSSTTCKSAILASLQTSSSFSVEELDLIRRRFLFFFFLDDESESDDSDFELLFLRFRLPRFLLTANNQTIYLSTVLKLLCWRKLILKPKDWASGNIQRCFPFCYSSVNIYRRLLQLY